MGKLFPRTLSFVFFSLFFIFIAGMAMFGWNNGTHSLEKKTARPMTAVKPSTDSKPATDVVNVPEQDQGSTPDPLMQTTLKLPDGKVIEPLQPVRWKDLSLQLIVTSLPPVDQNDSGYGYQSIISNHSTAVSTETVTTSAGEGTLVLCETTPPAASGSTDVTYSYWVIVYGSQYAYAIDAAILGNKNDAKNEVLNLLNGWKVPK